MCSFILMQLNPEMIAGNFLWPLRFSAIPLSHSASALLPSVTSLLISIRNQHFFHLIKPQIVSKSVSWKSDLGTSFIFFPWFFSYPFPGNVKPHRLAIQWNLACRPSAPHKDHQLEYEYYPKVIEAVLNKLG